MFEGILIEKDDAGYPATLTDLDEGRLPDGDVTGTIGNRLRFSHAAHAPSR
jgi:hypothetical protein